jgi:hypothetical protein
MRLYVLGLKPPQEPIPELTKYKVEEYAVRTIISDEGLFVIKGGRTRRMGIQDAPVENVTIAQYDAVIDRSKLVETDDVVHRMPVSHMCSDWNYQRYRLRSKSPVSLVLGSSEGTAGDMYFEVDAPDFTHSAAEDACAFLAKLNFC